MGQVTPAEGALAQPAPFQQGKGLVHALVPRLAKALLVELVALEQVARGQRDEVEHQHEQRLVLEGQQNAVAAALLALEGVVPHGTGAGSADVVALCRGTEHVFVTCVVGTPAQVHILKVGKEVFVKGADLVQNAFAVQRGPAAGREDTLLFGVAADTAAVAGLAGKAHPGHIVPGVIGQLPVKVADHQALHRKDLGVGFGGADELGQPLGLRKGVVVEQHHILALGHGDALIHRVGKAGVGAVFDQGEVGPAAVAAGLFQTFVGGAVVHHDELEVLLGLGVDRLDGVFEPALAVDVGDDDGCFIHKGYSCKTARLPEQYSTTAGKKKPHPERSAVKWQGIYAASAFSMLVSRVSWFSAHTRMTSPVGATVTVAALAIWY